MGANPPPPVEVPPLLEVRDLRVRFPVRTGIMHRPTAWVHAVEDLSLVLRGGETLGLVGESGSGKTTVGRAIVRVNEPQSGSIRLGGQELLGLGGRALRRHRRRLQMVFQDPYSSLEPRQTISQVLAEPLRTHGLASGAARRGRIEELMSIVGLPASRSDRYPHEFSGGQRQRIAIARALAVEPDLIVCDEPVSSLDVSIQAQVINLLETIQSSLGVAYLFISHDLAVVHHIADQLAVMYLGRIVETGPAADVYARPRHPYTVALLSAVSVPDATIERARRRTVLSGELPSPTNPPSGCAFHTRCPLRRELGDPEICATELPSTVTAAPGHTVSCHFADRDALDAPNLPGAPL